MDIIGSRTRDIAELALNGLYERQKATAANIANVRTPGYQRKDIVFEDQLQQIREGYDLKEQIKLENSAMWKQNPKEALENQDPAQIAFMRSNLAKDYLPQIYDDLGAPVSPDGNNVVLEEEMMKAAKAGTQYTTITTLLGKSYQGLSTIIKGQL